MQALAVDDQALIEQVNNAKKEFITDGYSMSIGELLSMYKEEEIIIDPDFQRAFRWSVTQQTRFIESILIGVPIPSIFVFQNANGKWEVVDGVQRLSTIFQFVGVLKGKDKEGEDLKPTILEDTKDLPFLKDMTWSKLPQKLQIDFKRDNRIEIKIIKYLSDKNAKFEVFQRLNWATILSGQEYRNALLVMTNKAFYQWMLGLSKYPNFQNCIRLSDKLLEEKYDQELVLRLFTFSLFDFRKGKVDDFINEAIFYEKDSLFDKIESKNFNLENEKSKFERTFDLLLKAKGDSVFQKEGKGQQFLESYFEACAIGLYNNIDSYSENEVDLIKVKIDDLENQAGFTKYKEGGKGTNSESRIKSVIPFGKQYFEK
ncbi:MAG: DUF262 domain-containing protein [Nitrosopumilus sp.]|nr:DUF262 domain-containing protein [Nitrosopumilus sp.]